MKTLVEVKIFTITIIIASLCTGALFSGCVGDDVSADYEPARRAAVTAWEELIGPVSDGCYKRAADAIVTESGYFPDSCMVPPEMTGLKYIGCYMPVKELDLGDDMIFLLDSRTALQKMDTAVHEYIHLLSMCELGNPDPFHEDERLWDRYGTNTVEALGCANLEL